MYRWEEKACVCVCDVMDPTHASAQAEQQVQRQKFIDGLDDLELDELEGREPGWGWGGVELWVKEGAAALSAGK